MDVINGTIYYSFGIGDFIILKEFSLSTGINFKKIFINKSLLSYRSNNMAYFIFVRNLVYRLFDDCELLLVDHNEDMPGPLIRKDFKVLKLYNIYKFNFAYNNSLLDKKYVIFHTKCRFSTPKSLKFFLSNINKLKLFFENFKCKYEIFLMGEKDIEQNYEAKILHIQSIYKVLSLTTKNNNVLDLTSNMICSSNSIFNFDNDLHIIHNAQCNITFGEGGNFVMCNSFSDNNICYIGIENYQGCMPKQYEDISIRDLDNFLTEITIKLSV